MLLKKAFGTNQGDTAAGGGKNSDWFHDESRKLRPSALKSATVPPTVSISLDDGGDKDGGNGDIGFERAKGTHLRPVRLAGDADEVGDCGYMIHVPMWVVDNPYMIAVSVVVVLVFLCLVIKISSMGRELSRLSALVERLVTR
jgi:hypothetical protein